MILAGEKTRKKMMMTRRMDFVKGALIGAAVGSMAGVLLAPKSGKETVGDIKETFDEIKGKVASEVSKMGTITRRKYTNAVRGVMSGYQEAKKITPEQASEIMNILDESFEQVEEAFKKEMK